MPEIVAQVAQVAAVLLFAPLLHGVIVTLSERVQRAHGPSPFQPYRDLVKLFHKETLIPRRASWLFVVAPLVAFTAMLVVPLLIPVLVNFPLPWSDMGDILGGGLILTLASFFLLLAGLDSSHPFGGIGTSRELMLAILSEPALIIVFVGITLLAQSMLPFVVNHMLARHPAVWLSPAHLLFVAAFLILLTVETERLPIHSSILYEIYMIGEARVLEYSGPLLALARWSSWMKQAILYTIFLNVLAIPWGIPSSISLGTILLGLVVLLGKWCALAVVMVVVDTIQSRLRFFRYQEPLALSLSLAIFAVLAHQI